MDFNLKKDLVFLDVEATGLNVIRDRIVQIALVKYLKNGKAPEEMVLLINPGIPISPEAMNVHGLTPKDLHNKPSFGQVGQKLFDFIGNADMAGYNLMRLDIPILMEEFARIGLDFNINGRKMIDAQRIFYKMEPRTLKAALKFYCDKTMENAHDALADVHATIDVLKGQIKAYEGQDWTDAEGNILAEQPVKNDIQSLHDFTNDLKTVDATQKLRYDVNGTIVFNFGKHNGKPVLETLLKDKQYYNWILNKEFSVQVKQIVKKLVSEYEKSNRKGHQ